MAGTLRIALTLGDPNGIGPEIALKAAAQYAARLDVRPVLVGDEFVVREYLRRLSIDMPLAAFGTPRDIPGSIALAPVDALPRAAFRPGTVDPRAGAATVAYVKSAVDLALSRKVAAIVGCPHSESAINRASIAFSGYPGLIAQLTGTPQTHVFLMLVAAGLRIAHVTLHERLAGAIARITPELVAAAGSAAVAAVKRLGIAAPRLGVFGINPHAGEDGLFGDDDERITRPAVERLRASGIAVDGPAGADVMLAQRKHDIYLAMFHDQGHIPVKLLSPLRASALAIGTEVLFSSVGHGSAFDIAGRGVAEPASVIETLALLGGAAA